MTPRDGFPIGLADERQLTRRALLRAVPAALALTWGADWLARCFLRTAPPPGAVLRVADVTELAPGQAKGFSLPDPQRAALLVRLDANSFVAFERRCPHLGCPVLWSAARARFECPCHNAAFDPRTGAVLYGPPRQGLAPIPIESRDDQIWLRPAAPSRAGAMS